ncbi:MAG TPA: M13 family metallopeptidase [Flavipsychrobacter sp.]|nr:M13 family metallopeptidase [Flavipsychrobacter sp.]
MKRQVLLMAAVVVAFAACKDSGTKQTETPKEDFLQANADTTIHPADDFFDYATGNWTKNNPIPGDESAWGIANLVNEELYKRKQAINEEAAKNGTSGVQQMIGNFWLSGMDTVQIEKQGIQPLQEELNKIAALQSASQVVDFAAMMHQYGVGVFYSEGVGQDQKNSEKMAYYINQGGLGLPNRDYYFNTDTRTTKVRDAYPAYVARIFMLTGNDSATAAARAKAVIGFEKKLAAKSRKLEDLRDPYKNYNKRAIATLASSYSNENWEGVLKTIGVHSVDSVIVGQPEFLQELNTLLKSENLQTLKDYLSFHLVNEFSPYLSKPFVDAQFDFYGKTLRGAKEMRPRWKRVLDEEEKSIGEAVGQLFAKEYFDETAKKRYEDMVENVRDAYKARIQKLDWMSDSTKQKALSKLAKITKKVGYPDKWKDFSSLKIEKGNYARNVMRSNQWWNSYSLGKLGKPVDRTEWDMTPQTYNAYYNPSNNEIVLPAGIFTVPGYRDAQLDDALVYGYAAASTIGHEITHGFDDEGRQYDENGNLKNWWTPSDEEQFTKRAAVLVNQFNQFTPIDTLHINGKATLGENLADLGGILIGLDAFKQTEAFKKNEKIGGYTPLQRYFLGYALGWLYQIREEQLASRILTDVHSPAKYRVNGPLRNVPEFYEAFNVKPGNKMYLPDSARVKLW